jgi:hypothetical protein
VATGSDSAAGFDDAVDALYGLSPGEFVAAREERAKAARAGGDRDLAGRIHGLRRPTAGAWMVNLLARERPQVLRQLLELGGALRDAQANLRGEELRTLTGQRQQLVSALVDEARRLSAEAGQRGSDEAAYEVERTLLAALADPDVGEQVATGALVRPLDYSGFGPVAPADVVERESRPRPVRRDDRPGKEPRPSRAAKDDLAAARRRRARADAEEALRQADTARHAADRRAGEAAEQAVAAEAARVEADREVDRLRRELAAAQAAASSASGAEREARHAAAKTAAAAERAAERHEAARRHLEELPD